MTTMSHIYLVILSVRTCCEDSQTTLRAFGEKYQAEAYMEDEVRQMARNEGLSDAVDRLMKAGWDKEHPSPTRPNDDDDSAYNVYREASSAHHEARYTEQKRLLALVGWDPKVGPHYSGEDYHLFIQEVPFGFEVVKPAEEEVAQAAE